jgi:hypothetical protein
MKKLKVLLLCVALTLTCILGLATQPTLATQAVGKSSHGYYWLLTDNGRWQCRSISDSRIQPHKKCIEAGAVKPK